MRPSCQRPKTRSKRSWRVGWTTYVPAARIGYGVHDDGGLGPRLEPHLVFHLDQLVPAQCANKWEYVHILVLLTCQRSQSEPEHRPCSFRFPPPPTSMRLDYQKCKAQNVVPTWMRIKFVLQKQPKERRRISDKDKRSWVQFTQNRSK